MHTATWNLKSLALFLSPHPAFHCLQYIHSTESWGELVYKTTHSVLVNQNPAWSWYLRWKIFQCRKEQSLLTFETRQCYKEWNSVLLQESDIYPVLHWQKSMFTALLVSLSQVLTESYWGMQRMNFWNSYGVILSLKTANFLIGETQTLIFSLQIQEFLGPHAERSSYYSCCSWL